jgi:pimeloyl-ACP methyl ester carboxylesterase
LKNAINGLGLPQGERCEVKLTLELRLCTGFTTLRGKKFPGCADATCRFRTQGDGGIYRARNLSRKRVWATDHFTPHLPLLTADIYFTSMMPISLRAISNLLLTVGGVLTVAYTSACLYLLLQQNRFIFFPSPVIEKTPAFLELDYEDVWLPVSAGAGKVEHIHGWWIPAASPKIPDNSLEFRGGIEGAAGVVLHLHGNGVNMGANVNQAHRFHTLGLDVLMIDYRGYGRSQGSFPSEAQVYEDAETAWNYLVLKRGINPGGIFIYGHSLGGAIGLELAQRHPEAAGLIVESSFTSMREMVNCLHGYFRIFPVNWLLKQRFDSISKVKSLQMPVLFIHGTADDMVPASMSQVLFSAAPEPKQLFLVSGAGHNDVAKVAGAEYLQTVGRFLQQVRSRQRQVPVG